MPAMNISLKKPANQPLPPYTTDEAQWKALQEAVSRTPRGFDVPMIIGGEEVRSKERIESIDPSTGEVFCTAQKATADHAKAAVEAALAAKESWAAVPPAYRMQKFRDLEQLLYERRHEINAVTMIECGYTAGECAGSWAEMIDFIRFNPWFYLQLLRNDMGDGDRETNTMNLRPLKGFTCAITPFNFPIAIGYNLPTVMALCGNTVVWKPSSDAPMTSWMLMRAIQDAGFPAGVFNMITGPGSTVMPPVLKHPELMCVNFTGGYDTARSIAHELFRPDTPRPHFPRFVAETGGKDFLYADKSCDAWDVASCIVAGAFGRTGQKCSANSLVLVDKKAWPEIRAALLEQMASFKTGNPLEKATHMGPVINRSAYESITGFIKRAKDNPKAKLLWGGEFSDQKGFFIQPTFFEVDADQDELINIEIFGPVVAIRVCEDVEHAIRIIRSNTYRLTGAVWSSDESFLARWVPVLSEYAGNFYVNRKTTGAIVDQQPFGGDGASGTNYKAGGLYYLLQFISQGTVTRRHFRTPKRPGIWNWM
jgi:1-pyrroline-5-carboxylate dehydrogenase